jgi:WD40 repeat protein
LASASADHTVKLWDATSGDPLHTLSGYADFVKAVAFSPDGQTIASGGTDKTIKLWNVADGRPRRTLIGHASWIEAVAFSPDGRTLASASGDHALKVWNVASGREIYALPAVHSGSSSSSIAFSPDGRILAAGTVDKSIKLWDAATGRELRSLVGHAAIVQSVAFTPDGRTLASSDSRGVINLWDVASARELRTWVGHPSWIESVAFSADGRTLASGSGDKSIRLWDVDSGRPGRTLSGHAAAVNSVTFAPNGQSLASGSWDNSIKVWDLATGSEPRTVAAHSDLVESVAFSPDGQLLVSGSLDTTTKVWQIASGTELVRLMAFSDGSSLEITPQGFYDFQGDTAEEYLNVRIGNEVSGISAYREKFYRPDLVRLALSGRKLPDDVTTLETVKPAPDVTLVDVPTDIDTDALKLLIRLTDRHGGIGDVRVFVNDAAVLQAPGRDLAIAAAAGTQNRVVPVRLVPGRNEIQVIAFNPDGSVHSNPARATVMAHYNPQRKPQLYALVIGIQQFENPNLDLKYSVADASAVAQMLQQKAAPIFEKVNIEQLTTPEATSKTAIIAAFGRYRKLNPDDVFLFYVASHGTVEGDDLNTREYFLIPSNVGSTSDQALRRDALSQDELKQMIASIPATKKLVLLDTCHSGALGDALAPTTRGLEEDAAVKILSGAVGSTVLSASTSDEQALEGQEGHGLFTWVLLQGLQGKADVRSHGYVSTFDLAGYVDDEVPRVAEQVFKLKQFPNLHNAGQAFPVVSSR